MDATGGGGSASAIRLRRSHAEEPSATAEGGPEKLVEEAPLPKAKSVLNALLGFDALVVGVLDLAHLGDGVGQ